MFFINQAYAADAATQSPIAGFIPLLLIMGIFYVFLIRPQQTRIKKHNELINNIKKGDNVVTAGGVYGTVVNSNENILDVKIASDVTVKIHKSTISSVTEEKVTFTEKAKEKPKKKTKK